MSQLLINSTKPQLRGAFEKWSDTPLNGSYWVLLTKKRSAPQGRTDDQVRLGRCQPANPWRSEPEGFTCRTCLLARCYEHAAERHRLRYPMAISIIRGAVRRCGPKQCVEVSRLQLARRHRPRWIDSRQGIRNRPLAWR